MDSLFHAISLCVHLLGTNCDLINRSMECQETAERQQSCGFSFIDFAATALVASVENYKALHFSSKTYATRGGHARAQCSSLFKRHPVLE